MLFQTMDKNTFPQAQPADSVTGFFLGKSGIRGRVVRLSAGLNAIIARHNYPDAIASLLGESLALTVALAFALKYDGVFTLQTKGDGPVNMLVVDVTREGNMRGYAQYDDEKLKHAGVGSALLLGKGRLAITVDLGANADRYQGIVEIIGRDMATIVQNYFRQSEQLETAFKVFVEKNSAGQWQAGAIMIQQLPEGGGYAANNNSPGGALAVEEHEENWRRAKILMETVTATEMLDTGLATPALLNRLFHEEDLECDEAIALQDQCRCSRQRVAAVLATIPASEVGELMVNNKVEVKCEFCSAVYDFDEEQIKQVQAGPGLRS